MAAVASGLQYPNVVDALGYDPNADEWVFALFETRSWDGSEQRIIEFGEKVNGYLHYFNSGRFWRDQPDAVGKSVRFELRCLEPPDEGILKLVEDIKGHLQPHGVRFRICVSGDRRADG